MPTQSAVAGDTARSPVPRLTVPDICLVEKHYCTFGMQRALATGVSR
jgi:hypothetical protein